MMLNEETLIDYLQSQKSSFDLFGIFYAFNVPVWLIAKQLDARAVQDNEVQRTQIALHDQGDKGERLANYIHKHVRPTLDDVMSYETVNFDFKRYLQGFGP